MVQTLSTQNMLINHFEPQRKFRWWLGLAGIDAFLCKTAQRPTFTNEDLEIGWINSTRYVASKYKFNEMKVTLHSAIAPSTSQQVMEWIRVCHEHVSGRAGYADFYKRDGQLWMLDPYGNQVELWEMKGVWVKESNFGDLDYDSNEGADIELSLRFDLSCLMF